MVSEQPKVGEQPAGGSLKTIFGYTDYKLILNFETLFNPENSLSMPILMDYFLIQVKGQGQLLICQKIGRQDTFGIMACSSYRIFFFF